MATRPEAQIADLMMQKMGAFVHSPSLPVAWPFREFTPPASGSWLEVFFLPNTTRSPYLDSADESQHVGIMQITVVTPQGRGPGLVPGLEIAGSIVAHFDGATLYGTGLKLKVTSKPSVASTIIDPPNLRTPVTVAWQAIV